MLWEPAIQFLSPLEIAYCCVVMVSCYALRGSTGFGAAAAIRAFTPVFAGCGR